LLSRLVAHFEVVAPDVDEGRAQGRCPEALVAELARAKARGVAARRPGALVIGADTVAVWQGDVLGKPSDAEDAARMLRRLSSGPHCVLSGLCVVAPDGHEVARLARARVHMRPMSEAVVARYAARPDALERAGAYALEPDDPNVERIDGDVTAVMGLPLEALADVLADLYPDYARQG
jgi:septum formation protein